MNIFKVLSSRKRFPEEMSSVLLGWLFYPKSEHGLGRLFLEWFVDSVVGSVDIDVVHQLKAASDDEIRCSLEDNVGTAFVDIVYFFGDCALAIENKIYDGSVMENQLQREYNGLRSKYHNKKIILVYLVPDMSASASVEYNSLAGIMERPHISAFVTWSDTICDIINKIVLENSKKNVTPISESTMYILQSLAAFIKDEFYGYDFIIPRAGSGTHSNFPRSTFEELKCKTHGFVGVALGVTGLLKMSKEEILSKGFQYDDSLECNRQYWLPLHDFIAIAEQRLNGDKLPIGFKQQLDSESIYKLICQPENTQMYIGIRGGERVLMSMTSHEIATKSWQVTTGEQPNSQWIPGSRYKQIYESKFTEVTP